MVGGVLATGGAGSTSNADGGKGGDITVTATAPNGRIDFGGVVDASGGARGGINRTDGAGGTITLTADFVKLDQTITTGLLDLNAPTVRLEGRLTYGSLKPVSASTKVLVGSVGTGSTGTGGSIQTAIDIAAVDATIMLDSGTFSQTGILIDKRVDIVGAGKDPANGGSIIESSGNINFTGRSGNPFDIITVTASGAGGMNTLLLQDFAVSNAILNGIVIDRGAATNTVGFVSLTNIASLMNGGDGLLITGAGMAMDLALTNVMLTMNNRDGLGINGGTVRRLTIGANLMGNSVISINDGDGIFVERAALSDILIHQDSDISGNLGNGIHVVGGTIAPETGVMGSFGFIIDSTTIDLNDQNGVLIEADTSGPIPVRAQVRDLTIDNAVIAANSRNGVQISGSDVTDLAIQNSYLGQAPIGPGGILFVAGNGSNGFLANDFDLHRAGLSRLVLQREWHRRNRWRRHPFLQQHDQFRAGEPARSEHHVHHRLRFEEFASRRKHVHLHQWPWRRV